MDLDELELELGEVFQAQADFCQDFLKRNGGLLGIDAFLFSGFDRGVALACAFRVVCKENLLAAVFPIVRMQYDTVLRSWGILQTENPFLAANQLLANVSFNKLRSRSGYLLRDANLVEEISRENPWFKEMYRYSSGWVHFSHEHVAHFLSKAVAVPGTDEFRFYSGSAKVVMDKELVDNLCRGVLSAATAQLSLIKEWDALRPSFGTNKELLKKYATK